MLMGHFCPKQLVRKSIRPQPKLPSPVRKAIKNLSPTPITSPKYNPIGSPIWIPTQDKILNPILDLKCEAHLRFKNELGPTRDKTNFCHLND